MFVTMISSVSDISPFVKPARYPEWSGLRDAEAVHERNASRQHLLHRLRREYSATVCERTLQANVGLPGEKPLFNSAGYQINMKHSNL